MKKYLFILALVFAPALWGQQFNPSQIQGGGSVDLFMQGGVSSAAYGTLTSGCVAITYTSPNFSCVPAADATHNGYLTSGDWNTFNGKQPAGSYALQSTTLTANSPLTGGGDLSTNRAFGCQAASGSQAGCLSAADWSTFNGKQAAGSYALQSTTLTTTSPITGGGDLSTNRAFACPTCATGPDITIVGGIIGGNANNTAFAIGRFEALWGLQNATNTAFISPMTFYLANPSIEIGSASSDSRATGQIGTVLNGSIPFNDPWLPLSVSANTGYVLSSAPPQLVGSGVPIALAYSSLTTSTVTARTLSGEILGVDAQILGQYSNLSTVAASTTSYSSPSTAAAFTATQNTVAVPMPWASGGTAENFCTTQQSSNGAGGAATLTLNKSLAASPNTFSSTSVVITIPASSVVNAAYCDPTHTATYAQFDSMTWAIANANAAAATGAFQGTGFEMIPSGSDTFMIVFGTSGVTLTNAGSCWATPFVNGCGATEVNTRGVMPRATTASVLACYVTGAPVTASETITLLKNGSAPGSGLAITITTGQSVPAVVHDTSHTVSFNQGDQFNLQYTSGAGGTAANISSCVISD